MDNNSRALATRRPSNMRKNICNNPACNVQIKTHLWIHKGVYCSPWCERNFGDDPSKKNRKF